MDHVTRATPFQGWSVVRR